MPDFDDSPEATAEDAGYDSGTTVVGQAASPNNSFFSTIEQAAKKTGIVTPSGALSAPAQDTLNALLGKPPAKVFGATNLPPSTGSAVPGANTKKYVLIGVALLAVYFIFIK